MFKFKSLVRREGYSIPGSYVGAIFGFGGEVKYASESDKDKVWEVLDYVKSSDTYYRTEICLPHELIQRKVETRFTYTHEEIEKLILIDRWKLKSHPKIL